MNAISLEQLLDHLDRGAPLKAGTDLHRAMSAYCRDSQRVIARLNGSYHTPEEIRALMSELTGKEIDDSFRMFPPFYSDFGKNITLGRNVFINACCCFQDQGGISVGDGAFIGHRVVLATLNHGIPPEERDMHYPAPVRIGKNVWIGSGAVILPGVRVGDGAIVAAGAVVSKNVESNTIVGGVPARRIKAIGDPEGRSHREDRL